jgi:predicted Zn-dependent protease
MKFSFVRLRYLFFAFTAWMLLGCSGPTQPHYTPQQENAIGEQQARKILSQVKLYRDPKLNRIVGNVVKRIARVSGRRDFKWRYYVIDNPKVANAFVLPGGKVFVYTGLFRYVANEDELAVVIGHEVAHALRSDGVVGAQLQQTAALVGALLQIGMHAAKVDPNTARAVGDIYGTTATLGYIRPFTRKQEAAADALGLMLTAKAGYDPRTALTFWKKFAKAGPHVPEYLSTHPDPRRRIAQIQKLMPKALKLYYNSPYRKKRRR